MARPRQGRRTEHLIADDAPQNCDRVISRTDESEWSLRRKDKIHRYIGLVESGLGQVHR